MDNVKSVSERWYRIISVSEEWFDKLEEYLEASERYTVAKGFPVQTLVLYTIDNKKLIFTRKKQWPINPSTNASPATPI